MTNGWTERIATLEAELEQWKSLCAAQGMEIRGKEAELASLTDVAADFVGTDPELRSSACIRVALDHAVRIREENAELRRGRDEWKREYSLINAGQLMAEEQVKKLEAELAKKSAEKEVVEERLRKVLLRLDFAREE